MDFLTFFGAVALATSIAVGGAFALTLWAEGGF